MGRPSKLTPEVQAKFLQGLKLGLTYRLAASFAGVGESTVHRWIARGDTEIDGPYRAFRESIKEAEGVHAAQIMARIIKAADNGNWQASAWILERRYPDDFGRRVRQDVNHSGSVETTGSDVVRVAKKVLELRQNRERNE